MSCRFAGFAHHDDVAPGIRLRAVDIPAANHSPSEIVNWKATLSKALGERFAISPHAPGNIGMLIAAQWQSLLLWWGFDPRVGVEAYFEEGLMRFVAALSVDRQEAVLSSRPI